MAFSQGKGEVTEAAGTETHHAPWPHERPGDLWVFAYGSLMWRPGFPFVERQPAVARGVHRRLCIYSHRYRGTPERPGLVLGLMLGGLCEGIAFRVGATEVGPTRSYLREREMLNNVYHEVMRPVTLHDGRRVRALCYVVNREHGSFAGRLPRNEMLRIVAEGHGGMGPNREYVCNTAAELRRLGLRDRELDWLAQRLESVS